MKLSTSVAVLAVFVVVAVYTAAADETVTREEWESYKQTYNKHYEDPVEDQRRLQIYTKNKKIVEEHNKKYDEGKETYYKGINKFSDMTYDEIPMGFGLQKKKDDKQ